MRWRYLTYKENSPAADRERPMRQTGAPSLTPLEDSAPAPP